MAKIKAFLSAIASRGFLFLGILSLYMGAYTPAHAGFFDTVTSIFTSKSDDENVAAYENSQRMALLRPALNPNQFQGLGGGDISVDDNALEAPSGPVATSMDDSDTELFRESRISIYVVHDGDTLPAIAKMFDVSANTIRWANDIPAGGGIKPGQTLVILPIDGVQHTVKKGETLKSIARAYKSDAEEIASFNDLDISSELAVGESIIIPGGSESTPTVKPAPKVKTKVIPGSSGPTIAGYYSWPVNGGVRTQGLHGHNGVDIGAVRGTAVFAAAPGLVIISRDGWNGGYGRMIVINHPNGTQTLYGHLSASYVKNGDYVTQGQSIGAVGSTGRSTGPHLHFEVHGAANPFTK